MAESNNSSEIYKSHQPQQPDFIFRIRQGNSWGLWSTYWRSETIPCGKNMSLNITHLWPQLAAWRCLNYHSIIMSNGNLESPRLVSRMVVARCNQSAPAHLVKLCSGKIEHVQNIFIRHRTVVIRLRTGEALTQIALVARAVPIKANFNGCWEANLDMEILNDGSNLSNPKYESHRSYRYTPYIPILNHL